MPFARVVLAVLSLSLCSLLLQACGNSPASRGELVLVVNGDDHLRSRTDVLEIATRNQTRELQLGEPGGAVLPLSFVISGHAGGETAVTLRAKSKGKVLVERAVRVKLVEDKRLSLQIYLTSACEGHSCGDGDTCGDCGTCESQLVSGLSVLAPGDDGPRPLSAPACWQHPASSMDAGTDAATDMDGALADADVEADSEGGSGPVVHVPDASAPSLAVHGPEAVAAPKGSATSALFSLTLPDTTALPVQVKLSASAGQVLAADCASPVPQSADTKELQFCLVYKRPDATRVSTITITASSGAAKVTTQVDFRMPAKKIASGTGFSCAILEDGNLQCWGLAQSFRIPDPGLHSDTDVRHVFPFNTENSVTFEDLSLSETFGCGLSPDKAAYCWGDNVAGELGRGAPATQYSDIQLVLGLDHDVKRVATGSQHACAVQNGAVLCWGYNNVGQIGPIQGGSNVPVTLAMPSGYALDVAAGNGHSCAIIAASQTDTAGTVYCWGNNVYGELGTGDTVWSTSPVKATLFDGAKEVFASRIDALASNTCAEAEGHLYCWGWNQGGETGTGTNGLSPAPVALPGTLQTWQVGAPGACAIVAEKVAGTLTRRLYCWGSQKGSFTTDQEVSATPILVPGAPTDPDDLGLGYSATCVLQKGVPYCWGGNEDGEAGTQSSLQDSPTPTLSAAIDAVPDVQGVGFGDNTNCLFDDSQVACWGLGTDNALGTGTDSEPAPKHVPDLPDSGITQISVRGQGVCALAQGTIYCWGAYGQIIGSDRASALAVPNGKPFKKMGLWGGGVCALAGAAPSAEVHCWDSPDHEPYATLPSGNVTDLAQDDASACAVVDEGVQCWGNNYDYSLGNASAGDSSGVPLNVDGLAPKGPVKVRSIASRFRRFCVIADAGDVWCWGNGMAPGRVFAASENDAATAILGADGNLCYVRSHGGNANELWCDGNNNHLQLSANPAIHQSSQIGFVRIDPNEQALVPPLTLLGMGGPGALCVRDQQGVKCWGNNYQRQLGNGPGYYEKTPAPVLPWMQ